MARMVLQGVLLRGAALALCAALTACDLLGGQTGEPTAAHCGPDQVTATSAWASTTVVAAVQRFVGQYSTPLQWQTKALGESDNAVVAFPDDLVLKVEYAAASASPAITCQDSLRVHVTVALTTSASGIAESGDGILEIVSGASGALTAQLIYASAALSLDAGLVPVESAQPPSGGFDALDVRLPGKSARFIGEP